MSLGRDSKCYSEIREAIKVGNYTTIAQNVYFHEPSDNHLVKYNKKCVFTDDNSSPGEKLEIEIGNDVWIGRGVKILPGVKIGNGVIIGAWSVIAKHIPDYAVVVGNPAQIKRFRFNEYQIKKLLEIRWWDWNPETILKRREQMKDIDVFLANYGKN